MCRRKKSCTIKKMKVPKDTSIKLIKIAKEIYNNVGINRPLTRLAVTMATVHVKIHVTEKKNNTIRRVGGTNIVVLLAVVK